MDKIPEDLNNQAVQARLAGRCLLSKAEAKTILAVNFGWMNFSSQLDDRWELMFSEHNSEADLAEILRTK